MVSDKIIINLKVSGIWKLKILSFVCWLFDITESESKEKNTITINIKTTNESI